MANYTKTPKETRNERINLLKERHPFLNQIIEKSPYPLFDIKEADVNDSILESKCYAFGCSGPESVSTQFYFVQNGKLKKLGILDYPNRGYRDSRDSSPAVKEDLLNKKLTPDFLVMTSHLKYEVNSENLDDLSLVVYKMPTE